MHLSTSGTSSARSTTPSPCLRWWSRTGLSGRDAAGEDEPGRAGAQHVGLGVAVAGLGAAVGLEVHAERELVEVRGLGGVADHEADGVHRGDRERVAAGVVLHQADQLLELVEGEVGLAPLRAVRHRRWTCVSSRVMASACRVQARLCNSTSKHWAICTGKEPRMDDLDGRLIDLFAHEPRIGVLEASRRLGVARGTVQSRLDRLVERGVITGWGPELVAGGARLPGDRVPHPGDPAGVAATTPWPPTSPASPRCSRRTPSPAPATCGPGSSPAPTPTCSA